MARRLVAIVGATATGKTALAIALAHGLGGEVINGDSRQVYRGMDIGTAKPTPREQSEIPHHLIDIADPDEPFSLAVFLDAATAALDDIWARARLPIIVGGTGQYVWALLEGWRLPRVAANHELRAQLEQIAALNGREALVRELAMVDPDSARDIDPRNSRRVIRAIEVTRATGRPFSEWKRRVPPDFRATVIGLKMDREALYRQIDQRVDGMMEAGFVDEVRRLLDGGYSCELPSMSSIGYRQICEYLGGELTQEDAVARIKTESHRLARMQHTWFRPDDRRIHWLDADPPGLADRAWAIVQRA